MGMRDIFNLMVEAMKENQAFTVGFPNDRFQYQQSGTTAGDVLLTKLSSQRCGRARHCPPLWSPKTNAW
eukprot:6586520-Karenia_brevis.AAC.1